MKAAELYRILTGCVLPRPIAWVSSVADNGALNLAPFSFFNVASVKPPVLGFSPLVDEIRQDKDTLVNIRETGEFVVNIVSHKLAEKMNQTSAAYGSDIDEFDCAGLATVASSRGRIGRSSMTWRCYRCPFVLVATWKSRGRVAAPSCVIRHPCRHLAGRCVGRGALGRPR